MQVRVKPIWMRVFNRGATIAFWGNVYMPPGLRERLEREDRERLADILDHEMIHVGRQHAFGMVRWHLKYVLSRRFRWEEEMAAYHSSLGRIRARGQTLAPADRVTLARNLSGVAYLFMTTEERARRFIDRIFE